MKTIAAALVAAGLTSGCATGIARLHGDAVQQRYSDYAGNPVESFTSYNINGWEPLARNKLLVWTGVSQAYLLTVWDTCRDLQFADRIGVTSTGHSISHFEKVIVGSEHCPISEIRPVDIKQMRAERAAIKAKAS
jgi:Family of unknown function (DUF6491)